MSRISLRCEARPCSFEMTDEKAFEGTCHILVRVGTKPSMHVHGQAVELSQRVHRAEQHDNNAPAFYCLNGSCQQIRSQRLKVLNMASNIFLQML